MAHLPEAGTQWLLALVSIAAGAAGIAYAYRRYLGDRVPDETGGTWDLLEAGYRVDDIYGKTIVLPGKALAGSTAFTIDARIVDGAVNGVGALVRRFGDLLRPTQTGKVRTYGAGILAGAVGLVIWLLVSGGGF
jgi:NADH-quinone oxidoreductase subunit L